MKSQGNSLVYHIFNAKKNSPSLRELEMCVLIQQKASFPASPEKNIHSKHVYKALGGC